MGKCDTEAHEMRCQMRWATPLGPYFFCSWVCSCVCLRERNEKIVWSIYILLTVTTSFPLCACRSCITSKAWRCREIWRGSWSRSCSQTQTTHLCWQAGATLQEVFSSRCLSVLPLTWSTPSPFTAHIRLRVAKWPSTCPRSRPPHVSGQYWHTLDSKNKE